MFCSCSEQDAAVDITRPVKMLHSAPPSLLRANCGWFILNKKDNVKVTVMILSLVLYLYSSITSFIFALPMLFINYLIN